MKKKIFLTPPVYMYLVALIAIVSSIFFNSLNFIIYPLNLIGVLFFILGFILMILTWLQFKENNTAKNFDKSSKLITDGFFKYSRNPMYVGMVLIVLGLTIFLKNILGIFFSIVFIILIHFMFIPYEEEKNIKTFGKEFLDYKKKVRKWF